MKNILFKANRIKLLDLIFSSATIKQEWSKIKKGDSYMTQRIKRRKKGSITRTRNPQETSTQTPPLPRRKRKKRGSVTQTPTRKQTFTPAEQLIYAIQTNNYDEVKRLIENNKNIYILDNDYNTPLHFVTDPRIAQFLIEKFPHSLNNGNKNKATPLHVAKNVQIAQILIENGASINSWDKNYRTPLDTTHDPEVARLLLRHGAQFNEEVSVNAPLPVFNILLENGFNIHHNDNYDKKNLLFYANTPERIKFLIQKGVNPNKTDAYGKTPLYYTKDIKLAKTLIENGANVNAQDEEGRTPLHFAEDVSIVRMLIQNGADVNAQDKNGKTPLHFSNDIAYINKLAQIESNIKSNISATNKYTEQTPYFAIDNKIMRLLIENGADVNAQDNLGMTPIFYAQELQAVQFLMAHGANLNVTSYTGLTPLHTATSFDIAKFYIQQGLSVNTTEINESTPLFSARNAKIAELYIQHGADVNKKNVNGKTPLHTLASEGSTDAVSVLLRHGAQINIKDKNGKTPLDYSDNIETTHLLLQNGASFETLPSSIINAFKLEKDAKLLLKSYPQLAHLKTKTGSTLLHYAYNAEVAKLLIQNGADVNATNEAGITPLDCAISAEIQDILIQYGAKSGTQLDTYKTDPARPIPINPYQNNATELTYSADEIPDSEIEFFCSQINFIGEKAPEGKQILIRALKEVCKAPTGRMSFRATQDFVAKKRAKNYNYQLEVNMFAENPSCVGYVNFSNPSLINICSKQLLDGWMSQDSNYYQIGATFLHEAQHTRQADYITSDSKVYRDAAPQALSRQLDLEFPYFSITNNFSKTERVAYERAVDYDPKTGKFNPQKARLFSQQMQQKYTLDFLRNMEMAPYFNLGNINTLWDYVQQDIIYSQFFKYNPHPGTDMYEYLKKFNHVFLENKNHLLEKIYSVMDQEKVQVKENCSTSDIIHLKEAIFNNKPLHAHDFSNLKAFASAKAYYEKMQNLTDMFRELARNSVKLHDNPNDAFALNNSTRIRQEFEVKYGIIIPVLNQSGERIAIITPRLDNTQKNTALATTEFPDPTQQSNTLNTSSQNITDSLPANLSSQKQRTS